PSPASPPLSLASVLALCSFSSLLFFFQASRPHRDLPSFPTRRSSDLSRCTTPCLCASSNAAQTWLIISAASVSASLPCRSIKLRSEEHTSELQSLTNLVCRLLLEKKKKRPQTEPRRGEGTRARGAQAVRRKTSKSNSSDMESQRTARHEQ